MGGTDRSQLVRLYQSCPHEGASLLCKNNPTQPDRTNSIPAYAIGFYSSINVCDEMVYFWTNSGWSACYNSVGCCWQQELLICAWYYQYRDRTWIRGGFYTLNHRKYYINVKFRVYSLLSAWILNFSTVTLHVWQLCVCQKRRWKLPSDGLWFGCATCNIVKLI